MRRLATVALTLALASGVTAAHAIKPHGPDCSQSTLMIGDSLTYHGTDALHAIRPCVVIDGVSGRRVTALASVLQEHIDADGMPDVLVIALGTNEEGATKQLYLDALDMVPASTKVRLVTTYRDPAIWGKTRAEAQAVISGWLREIAGPRPRACVIRWRATVERLTPDWLLVDGTHVKPEHLSIWANLISDGIDSCSAPPVPAEARTTVAASPRFHRYRVCSYYLIDVDYAWVCLSADVAKQRDGAGLIVKDPYIREFGGWAVPQWCGEIYYVDTHVTRILGFTRDGTPVSYAKSARPTLDNYNDCQHVYSTVRYPNTSRVNVAYTFRLVAETGSYIDRVALHFDRRTGGLVFSCTTNSTDPSYCTVD